MARETNQEVEILRLLADGVLAGTDGILARVWRVGPGDSCDVCAMRPECADRARCLHLVRSAGTSERIDGPFRRFPLGAREVGRVPHTGRPFVINDSLDPLGLADRAWLMAHDVRAFAAVPIVADGTCVGVLAVFARAAIDPQRLHALEAMAAIAGRALAVPPAPARPGGARLRAEGALAAVGPAPRGPRIGPASDATAAGEIDLSRPWEDIERDILERVLDRTGGRVSGPRGAATELDMKPTTLQSRLKKLGVRRKRT
jgi:transcriptional regulator with GAF, ATPase, and Fis domain